MSAWCCGFMSALLLFSYSAQADLINWIGGADSSYQTAGNWDLGRAPNPYDQISIVSDTVVSNQKTHIENGGVLAISGNSAHFDANYLYLQNHPDTTSGSLTISAGAEVNVAVISISNNYTNSHPLTSAVSISGADTELINKSYYAHGSSTTTLSGGATLKNSNTLEINGNSKVKLENGRIESGTSDRSRRYYYNITNNK